MVLNIASNGRFTERPQGGGQRCEPFKGDRSGRNELDSACGRSQKANHLGAKHSKRHCQPEESSSRRLFQPTLAEKQNRKDKFAHTLDNPPQQAMWKPSVGSTSTLPSSFMPLQATQPSLEMGLLEYGVSNTMLKQLLSRLNPDQAKLFNDLQLKKLQLLKALPTLSPTQKQQGLILFQQAKQVQAELLGLTLPTISLNTLPNNVMAPPPLSLSPIAQPVLQPTQLAYLKQIVQQRFGV